MHRAVSVLLAALLLLALGGCETDDSGAPATGGPTPASPPPDIGPDGSFVPPDISPELPSPLP